MTSAAEETALDSSSYLAWEDRQAEKHEYFRGEVFAMVGARREHVVVSLNLAAAFKQRLRGGPCQVLADAVQNEGKGLHRGDDDLLAVPEEFRELLGLGVVRPRFSR